jgi:hypothetical protein
VTSPIPGPVPDGLAEIDLLRDEFKSLKDEQRERIKLRDNLIYSVILSIAAVAGGTRLGGPAVPLLLPPVTLALGWTYLVTDHQVSSIGRYLRTDLAPRLTALLGADVLRWETAHRTDRRRRQRKSIQLAIDLLVFIAPAAVALSWYWTSGPGSPALIGLSVIEAGAVVAGAWQFIAYADITRH